MKFCPIRRFGLTPCDVSHTLSPDIETEEARETWLAFMRDRVYQVMTDAGRPFDLVRAALDADANDVVDARRRIECLVALSGESWWGELVELVERTFKISRELEGAPDVDPALFAEDAERSLWGVWEEVREPGREAITGRSRPGVTTSAAASWLPPESCT